MSLLHRSLWVFFLCVGSLCHGANQSAPTGQKSTNTGSAAGASAPAPLTATDPSYRLSVGDQISVTIRNQDLTVNQQIDRKGIARLAIIDETKLEGLTVREAERFIERTYREKQILKDAAATLVVTAFAPREVTLIGEFKSPGLFAFPRDATSMDIVELITRAGGFTPKAKTSTVRVTHLSTDGRDVVETVDVDNLMSGRKRADQKRQEYLIYPGDIINVDERLF